MQRERAALLNLPWEIRLQILEYLVHSPTPLTRIERVVSINRLGRSSDFRKHDVTYWRFETGKPLNLYPQILGVCRQLYRETSPILYANTLLISAALYNSFTPIDVLGYWKPEDLLDPSPGSRLPKIGKFANIDFDIYIDFTRDWAKGSDHAVTELCSLLAEARPTRFGTIFVHVVDGSFKNRYSDINSARLWGFSLVGLKSLQCQELIFRGPVPSRVKRWLHDSMVVDSETGIPKGSKTVDDRLMLEAEGSAPSGGTDEAEDDELVEVLYVM